MIFLIQALTLIFLTSGVYAEECCHESRAIFTLEVPIQNVVKNLEQFAASDEHVRTSFCSKEKPFTNKEIEHWLAYHKSGVRESRSIFGIAFQDESVEDLRAFEYLTTAVTDINLPDQKRQRVFQSNCTKVTCALSEIFGKDEGVRLLFMHRRFGMNGSHLTKRGVRPWKKNELDILLLSLSDYPEELFPLQANKSLLHSDKQSSGEMQIANANIRIFPLWESQTLPSQLQTITHELAHFIAGKTGVDDAKEWYAFSGWKREIELINGVKQEIYRSTRQDNFVSFYGKRNSWEDFAESVVGYRYNPQLLKKRAPEKYAFIKEIVFNGIEYTSEKSCKEAQRFTTEMKREFSKLLQQKSLFILKEEELLDAAKNCSSSAISIIAEQEEVYLNSPSFRSCYERSIYNVLTKRFYKSLLANKKNREFLTPLLRNSIQFKIPPKELAQEVSKVQKSHSEILIDGLSKAMAATRCNEDRKEFFYLSVFGPALGIDRSILSDELNTILQKGCARRDRIQILRSQVNFLPLKGESFIKLFKEMVH